MNDEITFGGLFKENIKRWIIKECIESGDPTNFFCAIQEAMDNIDDNLWNDPDKYWEKEWNKLK